MVRSEKKGSYKVVERVREEGNGSVKEVVSSEITLEGGRE